MKNPAPDPATPLVDEATATPQPSADQPSQGRLGEDTEYCRALLRNLLAIGNEIAEILSEEIRYHRDYRDPNPAPGPSQVQRDAAAYVEVAQSLRRTVMLHEKIAAPPRPRRDRVAARKKIIRDVEDAIESGAPRDQQESLHAELMERLDRPELEEEIAERPIGDIVTDITHDLGLAGLYGSHPWKRRVPHDVAVLNARAEQRPGAAPSEKLKALLATTPPRPTWPPAPPSEEEMAAMDMKTLMKHAGLLREPLGG